MRRPNPRRLMQTPDWDGGSRVALRLQLLGAFAAALATRVLTAGNYVTTDEGIWMLRTVNFSDALLDGNFADATASKGGPATMPGGPTMWLGSLGRLVWSIGQSMGLVDNDDAFISLSGLHLAQTMVALATSLLIAFVAMLVYRWAGWGAAAVTALFLVGEPWIGALGSILHTDELTALLGTAGLLVLALSFEVPDRTGWSRPLLGAATAGVLITLAPLTKATGLVYGVGAALVIGYALWRDWGRRDADTNSLTMLRCKQMALAGAGVAVVVPLMWPALLADPSTQFSAFMDSVALAGNSSQETFQGELDPSGRWYYVVALPFRMTPWFLVASVVAVPLALLNRATRARALWLLLWLAPGAITISLATKQFDRYGLVVLVPLAGLVGVGLGPYLERLLARGTGMRAAAGAVVALVVVHGITVAPWGLLYFNPVLGGADRARDVLLVGWGEGAELAIDEIRDMEHGDCDGITVSGVRTSELGTRGLPAPLSLFGVSCASAPPRGTDPSYIVSYINQSQRMTDEQIDDVLAGREQVGVVEIRGITVATIWR